MAALRSLWRLMLVLVLLLAGLLIEVLVFPLIGIRQRETCIRHWSRLLLRAVGIHVRVSGAVPSGACLIAANHVSWLDIMVINAQRPAQFVAKSEIRDWPVLGLLVARAGTHFIERARRHAVHAVIQELTRALREGRAVGVFPEGTTNDGRSLKPFHANLLQAALDAPAPVVPLSIRYQDAQGRPSDAIDYVGDITFVDSLWRILRASQLRAQLEWGDGIVPAGTRHDLAHACETVISQTLGLPRARPPGPPRRLSDPDSAPG